ncbi:MAG TPA: Tim44/TimA family putative adaptor protein [Lichenihabitans sp.]|jgi:predicted lipid-binding transport protein (Tim44 family)|nr:Tim44/TimA family putative adaptor protein [Lichenihabitans sp.]
MHEPFDVTTIVFAVLAVFVVWKLRSVLGTRTGNERPPYDPFAARRKAGQGNPPPPGDTGKVIRLPGAPEEHAADIVQPQSPADPAEAWAKLVAPGSATAAAGLEAIRSADPAFSAQAFMEGARAAYEMIVTSFARGDRDALVPLLAKDVYDGFAASIAEREAKGHRVDTTFVSMNQALIEDAALRGRTAQIGVRFQPQMITVTRDPSGAIVGGSPDQVADVVDLWTFARDVDSRNPNWKLIATETQH